MKDAHDIKAEIEQIIRTTNPSKIEKKERDALNKRILFLKEAQRYLESGAKEDTIRTELSVQRTRIEQIDIGYEAWKKNTPGATDQDNPKAEYNKLQGRAACTRVVRLLSYIISA